MLTPFYKLIRKDQIGKDFRRKPYENCFDRQPQFRQDYYV